MANKTSSDEGADTTVRKDKPPTAPSDPLDVTPRLYNQLSLLLDDMEAADRDEKMTMPQRISGMIALGRVMKMFQDLKRGELNVGAGSAVQRYAAAFQTPHAASGGDARSRAANIIEFDRAEPGDDDYEGDDA